VKSRVTWKWVPKELFNVLKARGDAPVTHRDGILCVPCRDAEWALRTARTDPEETPEGMGAEDIVTASPNTTHFTSEGWRRGQGSP